MKPVPIARRKRTDIQYLRSLAIVAVILFHFFESSFPQGFLGVDIFFVISGYLMTMLLNFSTSPKLSWAVAVRFYERRLRRLLPAYLFTIFFVLAVTSYILIRMEFNFLQRDAKLAALFATNFQGLFIKEAYFKLLSQQKFLLHTWSLAAEVQYYVVAPVLIAFIVSTGQGSIVTALAIGGASWTFQLLFMANPTWSFDMLPARIWQFVVGTLVFLLEKRRDGPNIDGTDPQRSRIWVRIPIIGRFNARRLVAGVSITVCLMPSLSHSTSYTVAIRTASTLLAGLVIYLGPTPNSSQVFSLSERVILYLGDISYSVYLVHWPVAILARYMMYPGTVNIKLILIGIVFVLSIAQYELFEKQMLHKPSKTVFTICALLYLGIGIQVATRHGFRSITGPPEHPLVEENQKIAECKVPDMVEQCNYDPEMVAVIPNSTKEGHYVCSWEGKGDLTFFVAGNSFGQRQMVAIEKALAGRYKKIYYVTRPGCIVFEQFNQDIADFFQCPEMDGKNQAILKKFKPDVMIIIQSVLGFWQINQDVARYEDADPAVDWTTAIMANYLRNFSDHTKRVVVIEPHGTTMLSPAQEVAKRHSLNVSTWDLNIPYWWYQEQLKNTWWRTQQAIKTCPKCEAILTTPSFCDEAAQVCEVVDAESGLSIFCDDAHLSPVGVAKMTPALKQAFDRIIPEVQALKKAEEAAGVHQEIQPKQPKPGVMQKPVVVPAQGQKPDGGQQWQQGDQAAWKQQ